MAKVTIAPEVRFWLKVQEAPDGCWNWTAAKDRSGYGLYDFGDGMTVAHRIAYRLTVGDVPSDLELDHLCRNRACVNPRHLEPVTHLENVRRAAAFKTHCPQGHPYSEGNTYRNQGRRSCMACRREWQRRYRQRKRASLVVP